MSKLFGAHPCSRLNSIDNSVLQSVTAVTIKAET